MPSRTELRKLNLLFTKESMKRHKKTKKNPFPTRDRTWDLSIHSPMRCHLSCHHCYCFSCFIFGWNIVVPGLVPNFTWKDFFVSVYLTFDISPLSRVIFWVERKEERWNPSSSGTQTRTVRCCATWSAINLNLNSKSVSQLHYIRCKHNTGWSHLSQVVLAC